MLRRNHQPTTQIQFPLLFAIADDTVSHRDRVSVFQSSLVREGPDRWGDSPSIYHIAPYRIFHGAADSQWPDDTYVISESRYRRHPNHHVMLVADLPAAAVSAATDPRRQVIYTGPWEQTGRTVLSMYCAAPIPVLEFRSRRQNLPALLEGPRSIPNRLPITVIPVGAESAFLRAWQRRWDPDVWEESIVSDVRHLRESSEVEVGTTPALSSSGPLPLPLPYGGIDCLATTLPSFVANAIVNDAITRSLSCPITMEPIAEITSGVSVTSCYHVFDHAALAAWLAVGDGTCPVCKAEL